MPTKIEWAEEKWNPIAGCTKVSEGCKNCYAERMAVRLAANPSIKAETREAYRSVITDGHWNGKIALMPERLFDPILWRKPKWIFVCSMSDLFHDNVPAEHIMEIFSAMAVCPHHTFLVLTKRPERMLNWLDQTAWSFRSSAKAPVNQDVSLPNVWLGVSVENQQRADERLPYLLELAAMGWRTFVSFEPLLGPINLEKVPCVIAFGPLGLGYDHLPIEWIIVGGESGPGARPMHPGWVKSIRDQCIETNTPFFFKQWGEWTPFVDNGPLPKHCHYIGLDGSVRVGDHEEETDQCMGRVDKKDAGRELDGRVWAEMPHDAP